MCILHQNSQSLVPIQSSFGDLSIQSEGFQLFSVRVLSIDMYMITLVHLGLMSAVKLSLQLLESTQHSSWCLWEGDSEQDDHVMAKVI